jgi:hypothetical protein
MLTYAGCLHEWAAEEGLLRERSSAGAIAGGGASVTGGGAGGGRGLAGGCMLTCADVCRRMLTYADAQVAGLLLLAAVRVADVC